MAAAHVEHGLVPLEGEAIEQAVPRAQLAEAAARGHQEAARQEAGGHREEHGPEAAPITEPVRGHRETREDGAREEEVPDHVRGVEAVIGPRSSI